MIVRKIACGIVAGHLVQEEAVDPAAVLGDIGADLAFDGGEGHGSINGREVGDNLAAGVFQIGQGGGVIRVGRPRQWSAVGIEDSGDGNFTRGGGHNSPAVARPARTSGARVKIGRNQ